jgi:hypothetical protein
MDLPKAQADMRNGYLSGAPGVAVSGLVWLAAAAVVWTQGVRSGVLTLFFGGMVIHPLAVFVARLLGRPGTHSKDNPLGRLALEGTGILLLGVALAYALSTFHVEHFFPVMLVVIGGRYLTFQTLYGMRLYWLCGIALAAAGLVSFVTRIPAAHVALIGGALEVLFSVALFLWKDAKVNRC